MNPSSTLPARVAASAICSTLAVTSSAALGSQSAVDLSALKAPDLVGTTVPLKETRDFVDGWGLPLAEYVGLPVGITAAAACATLILLRRGEYPRPVYLDGGVFGLTYAGSESLGNAMLVKPALAGGVSALLGVMAGSMVGGVFDPVAAALERAGGVERIYLEARVSAVRGNSVLVTPLDLSEVQSESVTSNGASGEPVSNIDRKPFEFDTGKPVTLGDVLKVTLYVDAPSQTLLGWKYSQKPLD